MAGKSGLSHSVHDAKGLGLIIIAAVSIGTVIGYLKVDRIRALM